jgi:hypothetical protein
MPTASCYADAVSSPFIVGRPVYAAQTPIGSATPPASATAEASCVQTKTSCPPYFRRMQTAAASAARWRDYDAAARTRFLRWVVSQRWQKTPRVQRRAVVGQLNAAKRTRVPMLSSVLPVLVVVTNRGEVPAAEARPEDLVCQRCGGPAQPYRPNPLRERVGVSLCRRHARIPRAQYQATGGLSLPRLRALI